MRNLLKLFCLLMTISAFILLMSCKKTQVKAKFMTGTGTFTIDSITFTTNDTLGPDILNSGDDLTLWPTASNASNNLLFIFDIPSQSSGSVTFGNGSNAGSLTPSISGYFVNGSTSVNYSSVAGSGSITKTSVTSFTFSCTVVDNNSSNTYSVSGRGTY
jgi:hypothetical protein